MIGMQEVLFQFLGGFSIFVNGEINDSLAYKTRKGVSLLEYLVLQRGKAVSSQRLIRELWNGRRSDSPENALKTMVSRLRSQLNLISPGLGACVQSEQGAYRWRELPGVEADVLIFLRLTEDLKTALPPAEQRLRYRRLMQIYRGDLYQTGDMNDGAIQASWLHREYLEAVHAYIGQLREGEEFNELCDVCQQAIRVDELDETLH
ncbi:MAG: winged helix-turn-helix domain-containing protein [Clostridia bacterium]|nr:winged helix-turn-helix domain-containing protein [Clostridia bacterium]